MCATASRLREKLPHDYFSPAHWFTRPSCFCPDMAGNIMEGRLSVCSHPADIHPVATVVSNRYKVPMTTVFLPFPTSCLSFCLLLNAAGAYYSTPCVTPMSRSINNIHTPRFYYLVLRKQLPSIYRCAPTILFLILANASCQHDR